ncbi:S8 family serine peptidase [Adlercreutzia equolifaciens]|uniref:S8 family serine peptidase n=2 Tax=Adlercreutzia TaxID=447020 RepID=UPI00242EDBE8|nr:S8 family serine peptidase [Adlercreutzia equolifaciens]
MSEPSHSKFNRVLCIVLSVLLLMTVAEIPESLATADNIEDEAVPMAVSADSDNGNGAEDERPSAGEDFLVDAEEASLAAEERSTDIDELGYIPGEVIVVYEDVATDAEKQAAIDVVEGEGSGVEVTFESGTTVPVEISDDVTVETAVEMVKQDPAVKYALPNYTVSTWDEPSVVAQGAAAAKLDDRQTRQWYLDYVKAPAAWEAIATNGSTVAPVKVAVIDTGASLSHFDLANVVDRSQSVEVVHGEEKDLASWTTKPLRGDGYVNGSTGVEEFASHGTHVSGVIAAEAGNGGILGVASGGPTACANNLVDLVVIDSFSKKTRDPRTGAWVANGTVYDIVYSLEYARDAGCKVVNMSLGFDVYNEELAHYFEELCSELTDNNDMLIVAAAGNSGVDQKSIPASCDSVIGVISLTHRAHESSGRNSISSAAWMTGDVTRSSFSNYGAWCDLSAPGESIYSTLLRNGSSDTYGYMDGTSMACPVVAAVASMVRAASPQLSARETREVLCETAVDLTDVRGKDDQSGWGAVDAEAALEEVLSPPASSQPPVAQPDPQVPDQPIMKPAPTTPEQPAAKPAPQTPERPATTSRGWVVVAGTWRYVGNDGAYATGWIKVKGTWYYLHENGDMATGWLKIGKTWYYLKGSGAMATGWLKLGKTWYFMNGSGAMATGWYRAGKTWYYSNGSGAMQANRWIGNYYVKSSGAMATSQWIGRYHVNASGKWDETR